MKRIRAEQGQQDDEEDEHDADGEDDEGVFLPSASHLIDYTKSVDIAAFAASVHEYVLTPFAGGGEQMPIVPNAFSDGSVCFPTHQEWFTSTFGVVHMKALSSECNANALELDYTCVKLRTDGEHGTFYTCAAPIFGGHYSSARAELAGVLFALTEMAVEEFGATGSSAT